MSRLVEILCLCQIISAYSQNITGCVSWDSENCREGNRTLTRNGVRITSSGPSTSLWIERDSLVQPFQIVMNDTEYSIVQPEHGGGSCNCLEIYFISNGLMCTQSKLSNQRLVILY